MTLTPDRIRQIRDEHDSEHRTHDWADRVIDELLTDQERAHAVATGVALPDAKGRTLADRVAAIGRGGPPVTSEERAAAVALLAELLAGAAKYGVTLDDFDWTVDLPGGCLDVVRAKNRR